MLNQKAVAISRQWSQNVHSVKEMQSCISNWKRCAQLCHRFTHPQGALLTRVLQLSVVEHTPALTGAFRPPKVCEVHLAAIELGWVVWQHVERQHRSICVPSKTGLNTTRSLVLDKEEVTVRQMDWLEPPYDSSGRDDALIDVCDHCFGLHCMSLHSGPEVPWMSQNYRIIRHFGFLVLFL